MFFYWADGNGGRKKIGEDYTLPTASEVTKGGVKVGEGLYMDGETLNANSIGGGISLGELPLGDGLYLDDGTLNVTPLAGISLGDGLTFDDGILNVTPTGGSSYVLPTASETTKGGVKIGEGLSMAGETLLIALGTTPYSIEGAMWLSVVGGD